jgi:hypothetical protein
MGRRGPAWVVFLVFALAFALLVRLGPGSRGPDAPSVHPLLSGRVSALKLGSRGGPVVTPAQAVTIAKAAEGLSQQAVLEGDSRQARQVHEGPALEGVAYAVRRTQLHADEKRVLRDFRGVRVLVPWQTGYPAYFLAEVATLGELSRGSGLQPAVEFLVMRRESAASRWKVAIQTLSAGLPFEGPADARHPGYVLTGHEPSLRSTAVHRMLAAYLNAWRQQGERPPGTRFADGPFTSELGARLATAPNGQVDPVRGTRSWSYTYALPKHDPTYSFAIKPGATLICSATRTIQREVSAQPGTVLYQPSARNLFGSEIPPGGHPLISYYYVRQSCIRVEDDRGTDIVVLGGWPGDAGGWPDDGFAGHPPPTGVRVWNTFPMPSH